jgi:hypothetical protein
VSPSRCTCAALAALFTLLAACAKSAPAESVSTTPPPIPVPTAAASATVTPVTGMPVVAEPPPAPDAATSAHGAAPGKPPPTLGKPKCICTPGDPTCNC